jgi:RNA polymerase sigma factor (TIGR02999 family)
MTIGAACPRFEAQDIGRASSAILSFRVSPAGLSHHTMNDVTRILSAIDQGDPRATEQLLPLVYDELRKLAAARLAQEKPGQTLQATALVHEAYLRLAGNDAAQRWDGRGHFFAAAAEAMRRILVEQARRKQAVKHGGEYARVDLDEIRIGGNEPRYDLLEISELLDELAAADPKAAELVKLRFFAGLSGDETAAVLGISPRSVDLLWSYTRAWLYEKLQRDER